MVVNGDAEASRHGASMALRPIALLPRAQRLTGGYARRAEPYGPALVFFFDDEAFVEQPGFWVRGADNSTFAAMPAGPGAPFQLFLRNAAAENHVTVTIDGQTQELDLHPREERPLPVALPGNRRAALINIQSTSGFRP